MNWTDERVGLLKKMWEEGISASRIATQLGGGVSRNAVIGKVHRLKIKRLDKNIEEISSVKSINLSPATGEVADAVSLLMSDKNFTTVETKKTEKIKSSHNNAAQTNQVQAADTKPPTLGAQVTKIMGEPEKSPLSSAEKLIKQEKKEETVKEEAKGSEGGKREEDVVVPISRHLTLLQLNENTCKWPIGDPLGAGFHFCGAKTCEGSPYCSYHSKIAFQPVAERRRIRG